MSKPQDAPPAEPSPNDEVEEATADEPTEDSASGESNAGAPPAAPNAAPDEEPVEDEPTDHEQGADAPTDAGPVFAGEPPAEEPQSEEVSLVEAIDPADLVRAEMQAVVDELQSRLRAVSAAYQRQQDELSSARDRLERQAAIREEVRRGEVVAALFDPVQNLRRSIDAVKKGASPQDTAAGLDLVLEQFMDAFQRLGLEEVPGKGARFDPMLHEALSTVSVADPALDGVVLEVFSSGYRIGSRLIEPARVVVGQVEEATAEA